MRSLLINIDEVIQHHSAWKSHLKKAVEQGQSELTVSNTRNPYLCSFGKWLASAEGKNLPHYLEIVELHKKFHEEAAKILGLALAGRQQEAVAGLKMGSAFNQSTAKLVNKLVEIRDTIG